MKYLFILLGIIPVYSCNQPPVSDSPKFEEQIDTTAAPKVKYQDVNEMILGMNDYLLEDSTYKLLSTSPLHVQISPQVFEGETDEVIRGQTIRSFVYIVFSSFARTDIPEITVTSIPLKRTKIQPSDTDKYLTTFSITKTINRETARKVMNDYVGSTNFDALLGAELEGVYSEWMNSEKLDQLKSLNDNFVINVYQDLIK